MSDPKDSDDTIAKVIAILAAVPVAIVLRGFVLSRLWLWFFVPIGVPSIGIAHAMGISGLVSMLTHQTQKKNTGDEKESVGQSMLFTVLWPLVAWGFGAIAHAFM